MKAEIGLRWLVAGAAVLVAGWTGIVPFGLMAGTAICWAAATSLLVAFRDRSNPGIAGIIAAIDSAAIFTVLSGSSRLGSLGWIGFLPSVFAARSYASNPLQLGSVNAGTMLCVHVFLHRSEPGGLLYVQMAGALALGWLARPQEAAAQTSAEVIGPTDPLGDQEPESFLGIRESFRRLKTMYLNLERQSRLDRMLARLLDLRLSEACFAAKLSERFREVVGAERVVLYSAAEDGTGFHPVGAAGGETPESKLSGTLDDSIARVRSAMERAWETQTLSEDGLRPIHIPLCCAGRIVGHAVIFTEPDKIDTVQRLAEDVTSTVASLLLESEARRGEQRQVRSLELRADLGRHLRGAASTEDLANRFVQKVADSYGFDHVAIWRDDAVLALDGRPLDFGRVEEVASIAAFGDARFAPGEMVRRRIGTLVVLSADGYRFSFASHTEGIVSETDVDRLRELASDFVWAITAVGEVAGLVSAEQFRARMSEPGVLALIEVTQREARAPSEVNSISARVVDRVLKTLPVLGATMVRPDGDVLVHLPKSTLGRATEWGSRAISGIPGVRLRTASLWPRANAVIGQENAEPEALIALSKR